MGKKGKKFYSFVRSRLTRRIVMCVVVYVIGSSAQNVITEIPLNSAVIDLKLTTWNEIKFFHFRAAENTRSIVLFYTFEGFWFGMGSASWRAYNVLPNFIVTLQQAIIPTLFEVQTQSTSFYCACCNAIYHKFLGFILAQMPRYI